MTRNRKLQTSNGTGLPRGTWLGKALVFILVVFIALPILWLAYAAFLPKEVVFNNAAIPVGFTLNNFLELPFDNLIRPLILSMILSTLVAFLQLAFALPAAFAIRAGTNLLWFFLLMLPISADLLIIPLYGLLKDLGLLNSPFALVLPFLVSPFTVFLLYSGLVRLPWAYVEAAKLDGASNFQIIRKVIAPLLRPELTAAGVLAFAAHWNIVLFPKVMLNDKNWYTVQVALNELLRSDPFNWGKLGAAAMLTSLPIIVLYLIFERRVTKTIEGGLK
jgi:multiple sugar transport system permease protein